MSIGSIILILRNAQDLSASQVARAAGISRAMLSLVEKGKREPSLKTIRALAKALNVPYYVLLLGEGELWTPDKNAREIYKLIVEINKQMEKLKEYVAETALLGAGKS